MICMENVSRQYWKNGQPLDALSHVDLTVEDGEMVSVIGPSGSGKTTLLNVIGCLDQPTQGRYLLNGVPVEGLTGGRMAELRNRQVGFVFQRFYLLPDRTALENTALPLMLRGVPLRERRERAEEALRQVGLADRRDHRPAELSGGQQQRVAIARVLAADPPLILADEPTGNLDPESGEEVMGILQTLNGQGKTLLLITHDRGLAFRMPRVLRMEAGSLSPAQR